MSNLDFVLAHSRTKGSINGVRNYRNYDGTLTEAGKERYNYYKKKNKDDTKTEEFAIPQVNRQKTGTITSKPSQPSRTENSSNNLTKPNKPPKDDKDNRNSESDIMRNKARAMNEASKALGEASKLVPEKRGTYIKKDYSNMSNKELSDRINRLKLEDEYGRITGETKYVKSGSEKIKDALSTIGAVVAIGASLAMISSLLSENRARKRQMRAQNNKE